MKTGPARPPDCAPAGREAGAGGNLPKGLRGNTERWAGVRGAPTGASTRDPQLLFG